MNWNNYYRAQSGGGGIDYNPFRGSSFQKGYGQRGRGLGGIFSKLFNFITPIMKKTVPYIKQGVKELGKHALQGVSEMATEIASGRNLSEVANNQILKTTEKIKKSAANAKQVAFKGVADIANDLVAGKSFNEAVGDGIAGSVQNIASGLQGKGIKRTRRAKKKKFKKYIVLKKKKDIFD